MSIKMNANTSNTKRLFFNSIIMYLRMILLMLITLYISRVTINTLGIEKFGLYSVISGFVLLAGVFTNILESTSQRFLSKSLGEGGNVSSIFESCISTHIVLSLIAALLIEMLGVWFINYKLRQDVISINEVYII
ncbi:O146 family O-antigen flippase, partial [Escherichia marmotae]|nr:O146 family O-antigen flippase [Escherichia marmotae]